MSDALPFSILGLAGLVPILRKTRVLRWAFALALAVSIGIQALGAFSYDIVSWNNNPDVNSHPARLWSTVDSQPVHYLSHPKIRSSYQGFDTPPARIRVCPVRVMPPGR
jgi:hypothetical protein